MWNDKSHQLALLELWEAGTLKRRKSQANAWAELATLPWTRRTGRRDELVLREASRSMLETMLERVLPDWRELAQTLSEQGLSVDLHGYRALNEAARARALPPIDRPYLNQRTAHAALGLHSKATLNTQQRKAFKDIALTRDGLVRVRPNPGLKIVKNQAEWDASELASGLGELIFTERALRGGLQISGELPRALLTVENLGTFVDVRVPPGWMVAFVPGWNTATIKYLLAQLKIVPLVHFGDLDADGVQIMRHLQALRPDLIWAVPPFWQEQLEYRRLNKEWPADLDLKNAPDLVQRLAADGLWLEQEALVLEARLLSYFSNLTLG